MVFERMHTGGTRLTTQSRDNTTRYWYPASCPGCGGVIVLETGSPADGAAAVGVVPEAAAREWDVEHLPDDVRTDWEEAMKVLRAGAARAAVVACGRVLESAARERQITEGSLSQRIERMLEEGLITTEFHEAMDYVRLIRNAGAHDSDIEVTLDAATGAVLFTLQALRLLFEVPGVLHSLTHEPEELGQPEDASPPPTLGS